MFLMRVRKCVFFCLSVKCICLSLIFVMQKLNTVQVVGKANCKDFKLLKMCCVASDDCFGLSDNGKRLALYCD